MICLGIESTAHTFGVGIVKGKKVIANAKSSYSTESGGIIPANAAEHHVNACADLITKAADQAGINLKDIDLIAFSQGPGIGHCLRIGAMSARALSCFLEKPIVGVNHCVAHLEIGKMLTGAKDPVLLYVSGANTQVIAFDNGKYRIFGETLDIGIGNFLDSFARHIGLGFPGGPKIEALAKKGKKYIDLPYCVKGMDVSLGGILTNVKQKHNSGNYAKEDLAYSVQETVFSMLLEVSERALFHCSKKELLLGGGVACNTRLKQMSMEMCRANTFKCFFVDNEYNVDNGAMIAWLGLKKFKEGKKQKIEDTSIRPYWRTDED